MTNEQLDELEARARATWSADGAEASFQANCKYIAVSKPWHILNLIEELRQARAERDWLANNMTTLDPCIMCIDCPYGESNKKCGCTSKCWLDAAKKATTND